MSIEERIAESARKAKELQARIDSIKALLVKYDQQAIHKIKSR